MSFGLIWIAIGLYALNGFLSGLAQSRKDAKEELK